MRAIHFLAAIEGTYWPEAPRSNVWFSGYWDASGNFDPNDEFSSTWILLHKPNQAAKSFLGGPILGLTVDERPEFSRSKRYIFKFQSDKRGKGVFWTRTGRRGANVHCSQVVEWVIPGG